MRKDKLSQICGETQDIMSTEFNKNTYQQLSMEKLEHLLTSGSMTASPYLSTILITGEGGMKAFKEAMKEAAEKDLADPKINLEFPDFSRIFALETKF